MIVKRKKIASVDSRIERKIIIGMITNSQFLQEVSQIYRPEIFETNYAQTISKWCIKYFKKYKEAPKNNIEEIYRENKKAIRNPDEEDQLSDFLNSISDEYTETKKDFNLKYNLEKAEKYFRLVTAKKLKDKINDNIVSGEVDEIENDIAGFVRIARSETKGIDPIRDNKKIMEALDDKNETDAMFKLPGEIGKTTGKFERGQLIAIVGSQGIGKTWWLQFISERSIFAGFDTLFCSLELSEKQMTRRYQHSINALPSKKHEGNILIPVFDCYLNQTGKCNKPERESSIKLIGKDGNIPEFDDAPKKYRACSFCRGTKDFKLMSENENEVCTWYKKEKRNALTIKKAMRKKEKLEMNILKRIGKLNLVPYPSRSLTIDMLNTQLTNWDYYDNFAPSTIITDYADKMESKDSRQQRRHQIEEIWEGHKAIAQERNCLVATASQSNTARTGKDIGQGDWAESITKLGVIDIGIALNQRPDEKRRGILRAKFLKVRDDDFTVLKEFVILQQLKLGKPYLDSMPTLIKN